MCTMSAAENHQDHHRHNHHHEHCHHRHHRHHRHHCLIIIITSNGLESDLNQIHLSSLLHISYLTEVSPLTPPPPKPNAPEKSPEVHLEDIPEICLEEVHCHRLPPRIPHAPIRAIFTMSECVAPSFTKVVQYFCAHVTSSITS